MQLFKIHQIPNYNLPKKSSKIIKIFNNRCNYLKSIKFQTTICPKILKNPQNLQIIFNNRCNYSKFIKFQTKHPQKSPKIMKIIINY